MPNKPILFLSLPLCILLIICSCAGFLTPSLYSVETINWQAQSMGQDIVDLFFIAPCLAISSLLAHRYNKTATMIWGGVVIYLTYTFVLYCFDVHFNRLFILYCICLGLSFYSTLYFCFLYYSENIKENVAFNSASRFIGIYFIVIAVLFYLLWLSEILPANYYGKMPKSISDAGLFTNGVHVIDIAVILPAMFVTGVLLLKKKGFGYFITPAILTFMILMDITIGSLVIIMKMKGIESNLIIAVIMYLLAFFTFSLLLWHFRSTKTELIA